MSSLPKWFVHDMMHFMVAFLVFLLLLFTQSKDLYYNKIRYLFLAVFLGAFIPDIDHLVYLKIYRFKSFREFIEVNIKSDRIRRGLLIFHNVFFMVILMFAIPLVYLVKPIFSYFLLGFLSHLMLDFLDDKLLIHTVEHWRSIKKFISGFIE